MGRLELLTKRLADIKRRSLSGVHLRAADFEHLLSLAAVCKVRCPKCDKPHAQTLTEACNILCDHEFHARAMAGLAPYGCLRCDYKMLAPKTPNFCPGCGVKFDNSEEVSDTSGEGQSNLTAERDDPGVSHDSRRSPN